MMRQKRASLPVTDWPEDIQPQWTNRPATWSNTTEKTVRLEAGRFFRFLNETDYDLARPNPTCIAAYLADRLPQLSEKSASASVRALLDALTLLFPDVDFAWLARRSRETRARAYRDLRRPASQPTARYTLALPFAAWPTEDQIRWTRARNPNGRRTRRQSRIARWRESSATRYAQWYATLLRFLCDREETAATLTPETVDAWLADCQARNLSEVTISNYLRGAYVVASALYPERDWTWFQEEVWELFGQAEPKRDKRQRIVHSAELAVLGRFLMDLGRRAPQQTSAAVHFRNGLILYFLAYRPIRLANLACISLTENLFLEVVPARVFWPRQKNNDPLTYELPHDLAAFLAEYIAFYRPVLEGVDISEALWLSTRGPLTSGTIGRDMKQLTVKYIGKDVSPHVARDAAATTLVQETPEAVELASRLLGHRQVTSTETYFRHANSLIAQRRAACVLGTYDVNRAPVWVRRRMKIRQV